eukprot:1806674-Rhodomonas_salina.2
MPVPWVPEDGFSPFPSSNKSSRSSGQTHSPPLRATSLRSFVTAWLPVARARHPSNCQPGHNLNRPTAVASLSYHSIMKVFCPVHCVPHWPTPPLRLECAAAPAMPHHQLEAASDTGPAQRPAETRVES